MALSVSGWRYARGPADARLVWIELTRLRPKRIIVGCQNGIDTIAAREAMRLGISVHAVVPGPLVAEFRSFLRGHSTRPQWHAYCHTHEEMPEDSDFKARNARLVEMGMDGLVAFPQRDEHHPESRRSGTWQTIRMARARGRPVHIRPLREG